MYGSRSGGVLYDTLFPVRYFRSSSSEQSKGLGSSSSEQFCECIVVTHTPAITFKDVRCRSTSQDGEADATRFQYVGYDPNSDKAIVQFMGSRKVSQLDAEEFLRMGSSGLCEHKSG